MGNYGLGGSKKKAKVMKINGEMTKLKTPIKSIEITKNHPGHVLLDAQTVKHYGVRAKPLDPTQDLEPGRLYFLVELPKFPENTQHQQPLLSSHHHRVPRRVRSGGIHVGAKDRLESLMLSRRSVSDLSMMKPAGSVVVAEEGVGGGVRVRMRLPRAEVERLMSESKSKADAAEKIMDLYGNNKDHVSVSSRFNNKSGELMLDDHIQNTFGGSTQQLQHRSVRFQLEEKYHSSKKRVGFMPINEGEIQLAVAS